MTLFPFHYINVLCDPLCSFFGFHGTAHEVYDDKMNKEKLQFLWTAQVQVSSLQLQRPLRHPPRQAYQPPPRQRGEMPVTYFIFFPKILVGF